MGKFARLFRKSKSFNTLKKSEEESWEHLESVNPKFSYSSMSSLKKKLEGDDESCKSVEAISIIKNAVCTNNRRIDPFDESSDDDFSPRMNRLSLSDCEQPLLEALEEIDSAFRPLHYEEEEITSEELAHVLKIRLGAGREHTVPNASRAVKTKANLNTSVKENTEVGPATVFGDGQQTGAENCLIEEDKSLDKTVSENKVKTESSCLMTTLRYVLCRGLPPADD